MCQQEVEEGEVGSGSVSLGMALEFEQTCHHRPRPAAGTFSWMWQESPHPPLNKTTPFSVHLSAEPGEGCFLSIL